MNFNRDLLSSDVMEQAKQAMDRALTPRSANGLLWGLIVSGSDAPPEQVFYPASKDPARTMWFAEEFAYGRIPPDLYYAPGREIWINTLTGGYWKVVYDDPILNLPPKEQQLLTQALALPQPPAPTPAGFELSDPSAIPPYGASLPCRREWRSNPQTEQLNFCRISK